MIRIGDFSRLGRVTVKALRHYDEIGLLKPVRVDEFTGYRYYSAGQITRLSRIIALKEMGLSLDEIARLLKDDVSIAHILDLVQIKQTEIKQRLSEESERLTRVEEWLKQVEKEGKMPDYEVVLKKVEPQKVLSIRKVIKSYDKMGELFSTLGPYVFQAGAQMIGPPISLYHDKEFKESDVDVEVAFPIAAAVQTSGEFKCYDLPGYETVASVIHKGSFQGVSGAYNALTQWIEANGYQPAGPNREIYFTDPNSGVSPDEYVTEVQWPVTKGK